MQFGTIDNASFKEGYGDFTHLSATVTKGSTYSIAVLPAFSWTQWNEYINVWIDFNQDGDFMGIGEQVLSGISVGGPAQSNPIGVSGTITIPDNALNGRTRMRISMKNGTYPVACENFQFGEVEDYTIHIVEASSNRENQILEFFAFAGNNQEVSLEWLSNGDWQASSYHVERSTDNLWFYTLKEVLAQKEKDSPNYYLEADQAPLKGISYYRIRQINVDGSFMYSSSQKIERTFGLEEFYIFPNPVNNRLYVNLNPFIGKKALIKIYNSYGQVVLERILERVTSTPFSLNLSREQNGMYYLLVEAEGLQKTGRKFILNRMY